LSFALEIVAKLLCFNLSLSVVIVELHAMDEKSFKMGQLFALFVLNVAGAKYTIGLAMLSH
jgi:NADH:ubiquinone oxidoreductase subunit K